MIERIKIENYKNFNSFEFDGFKRVNLIAGKNNVGKTNLLEAIYVLQSGGKPFSIILPYSWRNPFNINSVDEKLRLEKMNLTFERAYFSMVGDRAKPTKIESNERFILSRISNYREIPVIEEDGKKTVQLEPTEGFLSSDDKLSIEINSNEGTLNFFRGYNYIRDLGVDSTMIHFISTNDFEKNVFKIFSDRIIINKGKKDLLYGLSLAFGFEIFDFRFIESDVDQSSTLFVFDQNENPISSSIFGFGTNRIVKLILFVLNSANSTILIDEMDIGIHYSKQEQLWTYLFTVAKKLNVQIFATTHSRDCVEAFSEVSNKFKGEGQYIRLQERGGEIQPKFYDEEARLRAVEVHSEMR